MSSSVPHHKVDLGMFLECMVPNMLKYKKKKYTIKTGLSHPVKYFTDRFNAVLLLRIVCTIYVLCLSCFRLLWSPAGKGLTSWLLFVMLNCVFVTFPS